jgi:hypothetical protein
VNPSARTLVGLVALVASVGACRTEPPYRGPPTASAVPYQADFDLTVEHPVAIRGLRFVVDPGDQALGQATPSVFVRDRDDSTGFGDSKEDTWISIIDPASGKSWERDAGLGHASIDGWGHYGACPSTGCDETWAVIVRWLKPRPDATVKARLDASIDVSARDVPDQARTTPPLILDELSVAQVGTLDFDGAPATTSGRASGSFRSTPTWPGETHRWTLHVPAALIGERARYPRVGRVLIAESVTEWSGAPAAFSTHLVVGDSTSDATGGPIALELDWSSGCRVAVDCDVPITVTFGWSAVDSRPIGSDPVMAADWYLVAMLEDSTPGATLPPGLQLEALPGE